LRARARALEPGERAEVLAYGVRGWHSWVLAATGRRLFMLRRGLIARGEEVRSWSDLQDARMSLAALELRFAEEEPLVLRWVGPGPASERLAAVARRHAGGGGVDPEVVRELARSKLGRSWAWSHDADLVMLADRLRDGEEVQRLAGSGVGLVAVTTDRILVIHSALRRRAERCLAYGRGDVTATPTERGLVLTTPDGDVELADMYPGGRREELLAVLTAPAG
jgi:hypothetical protein